MLVIGYVPCGSKEEAKKISQILLEEKLAACVNIIQSTSRYMSEDDLEKADEWIILAKTLPERFDALKERAEELHSYDVPCIIGIPVVDVNDKYLEWVNKQL
jgi:periplasmic divalent cation tolerance protein